MLVPVDFPQPAPGTAVSLSTQIGNNTCYQASIKGTEIVYSYVPKTVTSSIEQAPLSYFKDADTIELYDNKNGRWIPVDRGTITRFKGAGFRDEHLEELLALDISLDKAAQLVIKFTDEELVSNKTSPDEILELLKFEIEVAHYFDITLGEGSSFASARESLKLDASLVDETIVSQFVAWHNSDRAQRCGFFNKCDYRFLEGDNVVNPIASGSKQVFTLSNVPGLIFKVIKNSFDDFITDSFNKRILGKKIAKDHGLDLLIFPKVTTIDLTGKIQGYRDSTVALLIEEMLPVAKAGNFYQAELFKIYGDKLNAAFSQFTTFVVHSGGMGDLHRSNLLILDTPDRHGNYQFGLIDLDHLRGGLIRSITGNYKDPVGYYGYPNRIGSHIGILHFTASEGQIAAIKNQLYKELGWIKAAAYLWFNDFETAVRQQRALIERDQRLVEFHETRQLSDNSALEVSLADLDLGFITDSRVLERLLDKNLKSLKEFNKSTKLSDENMIKNLTIITDKIMSNTYNLNKNYADLIGSKLFSEIEKQFIELMNEINKQLNNNDADGIVKKDRFIVIEKIYASEIVLMLLDMLQEKGYIFDYVHNGRIYIQL